MKAQRRDGISYSDSALPSPREKINHIIPFKQKQDLPKRGKAAFVNWQGR
jgi:hypothetical protein